MIMKKASYLMTFFMLIFFACLEMAAAKEFNKDFHQSFDVKKEVDHLTAGILDADIKTDDGNVDIELERELAVSFHVSSNGADNVRLELDNIENYKEDRHTKSGSINGGNGRLKISTGDGDVTIKEE